MPAMFIERERGAIDESEWRAAVERVGARFVPGTLDVMLRESDGTWREVLTWRGSCAELSMTSFYAPLVEQVQALAEALGAIIIDNDGARY